MKQKLSRYVPLEVDVGRILPVLAAVLGLTLLFSLHFFAAYDEALRKLYERVLGRRVLIEGAKILPFAQLSWWTWWVPMMAVPAMLGMAASFFQLHRQGGSRSIYLMRRLPNRWELLRRCLAAPLAILVSDILFALALQGVYYLVYCFRTPAVCLP